MQKEKTKRKTLMQNVTIRKDARTHAQTERPKLYTPRHTSYAGGIIIASDKEYPDRYFSTKKYAVGSHKKCLVEALPMNICNI